MHRPHSVRASYSGMSQGAACGGAHGSPPRACTHKSWRLIVMAVTKCLIWSAEGERVHSSVEVGVILCRLRRAAWAARASTSTYAKEFGSWQLGTFGLHRHCSYSPWGQDPSHRRTPCRENAGSVEPPLARGLHSPRQHGLGLCVYRQWLEKVVQREL